MQGGKEEMTSQELQQENAPVADGVATVAAVANAFLDFQDEERGVYSPIDHMKLQKLVYYAHAWWLAHTGEPLFGDDVEAWPWGPVVRKLYSEFADHGRNPIEKRATELVRAGPGLFDFRVQRPEPVSEPVRRFLRSVWDAHKRLTGVQLSNATHAPGEPWTIIRDQYGSLDSKPRIPNEVIRDVFRSKLATAHKQSA